MFQFPNGIWHLARPQFDLIQKPRFFHLEKNGSRSCVRIFVFYYVRPSSSFISSENLGKSGFIRPIKREGKENLAVKNELVIFF